MMTVHTPERETMCQVTRVRRPHHAGFTLLEALTIVAIITVLIALVLTGLGRAREMGRRAACVNHVRQVSAALLSYAAENDQFFPAKGENVNPNAADWVYWQMTRDWRKSAITPFLGGPTGFDQTALRCPTDQLDQRLRNTADPYLYSYTLNGRMASNPDAPSDPVYPTGPIRLRDVIGAPGKILLVDEDARSLDDGNFNGTLVGKPLENMLATRHDRDRQTKDARGIVGMADGHAEFVERAYVQDVHHFEPTAPLN
jgi:type II secretory pathway pseudopilin PulG